MGNSIEFGWMVSTLLPAYRYKADKCGKCVVVDDISLKYLYDDFATRFWHYPNQSKKKDRWLADGKEPKTPKFVQEKYQVSHVWHPSKTTCIDKPRSYRKYGRFRPECTYGLVIHARAIKAYGSGQRNWPVENYVQMLSKLKYTKACSVGSVDGAYHIPGTEDKRGIDIEDLCNIFASSKVAVGTSSGPMHLASHCGCPHVVLTYNKKLKILRGRNNAWRYRKGWNPFDTPCSIIDKYGWKPPVEPVVETVWKYL